MGIRLATLAVLALGCTGEVLPAGEEPPPEPGEDSAELGLAPETSLGEVPLPAAVFTCPEGLDGAAGRHELAFEHDGRTRRTIVHVPESYDPSVPTSLVFNLHGYMSADWQQALLTHMHEAAEARGVIVAYPQGVDLSWNAGDCCGTAWSDSVDDVGFVRALLDRLEATYCVDPARVYATGMSNGGFMSHRLACEMSDRIAAVAPVAGVLGIDPLSCAPERAVPVLQFHGTADGLVPYGGGTPLISTLGFGLVFRSVEETIAHWSVVDGCEAAEVEMYAAGDATCVRRVGCEADVELCTVAGGGHTWPGGLAVPFLGHTTTDVDATERMLDFFEDHPMR